MTKYSNVIFSLLLVVLIALAAIVGAHIEKLRDSDAFLRWIVSVANQVRVQGDMQLGAAPQEEGKPAPVSKDKELYASIESVVASALPDVSGDLPPELAGQSKLIQYAYIPGYETGEDGKESTDPGYTEGKQAAAARLEALWSQVKNGGLTASCEQFAQYRSTRQLVTLGSQFNLGDTYKNQDTMVSLGNVFFGFRQMAANLLWLQSDKYWHGGEYYRMKPVMWATVKLDPSFVDAYLVGAWHMAYNATYELPDTPIDLRVWDRIFKVRVGEKERFYYEGVEFLKDGILKNPSNYKLYFDLGFAIYENKLEDHANAVKYLAEACRQQHDKWVPRMLYRSMMRNGEHERSIVGYLDYQKKHPESVQENIERFIRYNKAYIEEREANNAEKAMRIAQKAAEAARQEAQQARAVGDEATALAREATAAQQDQAAQATLGIMKQHHEGARAIWRECVAAGEDPLAEGRIQRTEALELVAQGRVKEALALLDYARSRSDDLWEELSNLIIDIKISQDVELNLSEKMALSRRHIGEAFVDREFGDATYQFRDDGWYDNRYNDEEAKLIGPSSSEVQSLAAGMPELPQVIELATLLTQYPDLKEEVDLGHRVIFKAGDVWYCYDAQLAGEAPKG